ncbi:MAG: DUF554 domain-containing protein [Actinomycetales bacterium]
MVGAGTALNVATVLVGSTIGVGLGHRLPQRTRDVVTDALGLVTMLIAVLSAASVVDRSLADRVGSSAPVLIVLGSLLIGGIVGSLLRIEERLEGLGASLQRLLTRGGSLPATQADGAAPAEGAARADGAVGAARARFVEGFVSSSLVFCVGPLTILGSLSDGLGHGIDQLALKSTLDGFASIAFAASLGWGVAASALAVAVVQGLLTLAGYLLGNVMDAAQIAGLTAAGGLLLAGVALRLLRMKQLPVGDLLPALVVAPLLVSIVGALR